MPGEKTAMGLTKLTASGQRRALGCGKHRRKAPSTRYADRSISTSVSESRSAHSAAAAERARAQLQSSAQESRRPSFGEAKAEHRHDRVYTQALSERTEAGQRRAWCRSVQEATCSTWNNVRERTVRHEAADGAP